MSYKLEMNLGLYSLMDLNPQSQDDSSFTIGIQTEWQLEMMAEFGHNNQIPVQLKSMSFMLDNVFFNVIDIC